MLHKKLSKPLAFFDLETTGIDVAKDRIVQICVIRVELDGTEKQYSTLINPTMSIPSLASQIHGIYDQDVVNAPKFRDIAPTIKEFMQGADLVGYNSNYFDVPLLVEEFLRCDVDFPDASTKLLDACIIFKKKEERTLKAALQFYCQKDLEGAHNAENDVRATLEVFSQQLQRYNDLAEMNMDQLHEFCVQRPVVDFSQRLSRNPEGEVIFNFGQHKGKCVKNHPDYIRWMLQSDFPLNTKKILKSFLPR